MTTQATQPWHSLNSVPWYPGSIVTGGLHPTHLQGPVTSCPYSVSVVILTVQSPSIIHHHIYCLFEKSMSLISLTWSLGLKQYYLKPLQVFHYVLP